MIEALEANNAYRAHPLNPETDARSGDDRDFAVVLDRDVLESLLSRLPARERRILVLRYFDELSQEQIARIVGTSQVHVGRLIASSLAMLRNVADNDNRND